MPKVFLPLCLALISVACLSSSAFAEDWPGWRGPRGDGSSLETDVPVRWDGEKGENIAWKVELPGQGHASPIVSKDRVFLVACLKESQQRILLCLDRRTGKTLWQRNVVKSPLESKHNLNSFASGTPATDGKLVYVTFLEVGTKTVDAPNVGSKRKIKPGRIVVAAYDFAGNRKWITRTGDFISAHGFCSSPVLFEDLLIINGDHDGESYVVALKKATGKMVWKVPRRYKTRSYVTPLIREIGGRTQMVFSGSECIVSLDPRTGTRHWTIEGPTEQFVASMVFDGERFYMAAGYPTHHVMAIRPGGKGDVSDTHVVWHAKNARCYVPSPVVVGKHLLVADDRGTANCFETATGDRLWQARLGIHFSASLITAGGLVYFVADDGLTKIVKPGDKPTIIAENPLGEFSYASPAVAHNQIYIRGTKHLFCIGTAAAGSN